MLRTLTIAGHSEKLPGARGQSGHQLVRRCCVTV